VAIGLLCAPAATAQGPASGSVIEGPDQVSDGWAGSLGASFTDGQLRCSGTAWSEYCRCLVRFDLGGINPSLFGRVAKATLHLTATEVSNPSGRATDVAPSTQPWTDAATLDTADGTTPWPKREGSGNIDYAMRMDAATSQVIGAPGDVAFDVTDVVDGWLYQGVANDGFILRTGDTVFGLPDSGTWTLTFADSSAPAGAGPRLIVEMAGSPPSPETIADRTLRWYPSPLLPPVRTPYVFMWYFGEAPRYPGAVTNAGGLSVEDAERGMLPLGWFYGPQNPYWKTEQDAVDAYAASARSALQGGTLGIMVDEWQPTIEGEAPLAPADPYGITGSLLGMAEAKRANPGFYIVVAWRGEDTIEPATRGGLPDLLAIEAYSHVAKSYPREWGTCGDLTGTKMRIDTARRLGMIEQTIPWLGMILAPEDYHEGDRLTPDMVEQQIRDLRAYAPEMPGVAFYANGDPGLAEACDRLARRYFVEPAPDVAITEPLFGAEVSSAHIVVRAEAKPKEARHVVSYRWLVDNRLVAETTVPRYVWDLRGELPGLHFVTVHAVDDAFNRAAAQVLVTVRR